MRSNGTGLVQTRLFRGSVLVQRSSLKDKAGYLHHAPHGFMVSHLQLCAERPAVVTEGTSRRYAAVYRHIKYRSSCPTKFVGQQGERIVSPIFSAPQVLAQIAPLTPGLRLIALSYRPSRIDWPVPANRRPDEGIDELGPHRSSRTRHAAD